MTTEMQQATPTAGPAPQEQAPPAATGPAPQGVGTVPVTAPKADELDALLKEFETPAQRPEANAKPASGNGAGRGHDLTLTPDRLYQVVDFVERAAAQSLQADIQSAVSLAKQNEGLKHLPDALVREMLEGSAVSDQRLRDAWKQRHDKPEVWGRVVESWATKKADAFRSLADPRLSQDREALAAAVRGQTATPPQPQAKTPQEVHAMSDQDFRAWKDRQLGA